MIVGTLCFIKKDKKTLMLHRNREPDHEQYGLWNGVGGKLERGESPEECAIREIKEETGLDVKELELKGILSFPEPFGSEPWTGFVFVVRKFSGKLRSSEEGELEWIDDNELLSLPLLEGDKYFFPLIDKKGLFSAKLVYDGNKLLSHEIIQYQ